MTEVEIDSQKGKARRLRQLVLAMTLVLTFEGIARKALPGFGIPLFFLKDFLTLAMGWYVFRMRLNTMLHSLFTGYVVLMVLMIPTIIMTAFHDPILAVFGAKQYLLFPIVGFATFMAFEDSKWQEILSFYRWFSLLVIPTTLMAIAEVKLPHTSWLNLSVNGGSLEAFQAEGQLRVSSTFSFVAQYCAFLNVQTFAIFIAFSGWSQRNIVWKLLILMLIPAIIAGSFVTGSRTAVAGNLAIIVLALILSTFMFKAKVVFQMIGLMVVLYLGALAVNHFFPSWTAAYTAREGGQLIGFSSEIRMRVYGSFFGVVQDKSLHTFWGNGLGAMSNGADVLSHYAAVWRTSLWTESDFSSVLFEGGYYLSFIWFGFRLFVILTTFRNFVQYITPEYSVCMSFCQAFVTVMGLLATISIQPPIAIWWWFGVGTSLLFSWKCSNPPEVDQKEEGPPPPAQVRKIRGRSLYADVIHEPK